MNGTRIIKDDSKKILESIRNAASMTVDAGVLDDAPPTDGGLSMAELAALMEFGTETAPERSFIRAPIDSNTDLIGDESTDITDAILSGTGTKEAFERLGRRMVEIIRRSFGNGQHAPNAPSTIKKKGSSTPLADSGKLRSSIDYKVNEQ